MTVDDRNAPATETTHRLLRYWGKTDRSDVGSIHPAFLHCLDVAAVGRQIFEKRPDDLLRLAALAGIDNHEALLDWLTFLLALHDIGKIADGFQGLAPEHMMRLQGRETRARYERHWRHDVAGWVLLRSLLADDELRDVWPAVFHIQPELADPWLAAVAGHHGKPPSGHYDHHRAIAYNEQFPPIVVGDARLWVRTVASLILPQGWDLFRDLPVDTEELFHGASWLVAGWAVCADWLGSSTTQFPFHPEPVEPQRYWMEHARPAAERAVKMSGLAYSPVRKSLTYDQLWGPDFAPTDLQSRVAKLPLSGKPQLFLIEEATGGGKTEAALLLANRLMAAGLADGLYFALPTMATANAMHGRVGVIFRQLFEASSEPSLVLAHSGIRLRHALEEHLPTSCNGDADEDTTREAADWLLDSRKKALLADVGVGTIDQALIGVLPLRHQSLRLWGLLRKVLIVDEVHAADAYLHRLLCGLLEFHAQYGGSAILLSATLPKSQRRELVAAFTGGAHQNHSATMSDAYPALLVVDRESAHLEQLETRPSCRREVSVELVAGEPEIDQLLESALVSGGCACWLRNTVGDATEAYERWASRLGRDRVRLFHSRFTVEDRATIERGVLARFGPNSGPGERAGQLLIATQVVEQSLDLDFDAMVSDLAPVDLLIQRLGRLRRHARDASGERIDGPDRRGPVVFHVHSPPPSGEVGASWFSASFPRAAWVYRDHGQLWLTANELEARGTLRIPDDLRPVIEAVYGPAAYENTPPELLDSSNRAEGDAAGSAALALLNTLRLFDGYGGSAGGQWDNDVETPTRLGEPTTRLRLVRDDGGVLGPWHDAEPYPWELSEVRVRRSQVAEAEEADQSSLASVLETMPDKARWSVAVRLQRAGERWVGRALDNRQRPVEITYDSMTGLCVERT